MKKTRKLLSKIIWGLIEFTTLIVYPIIDFGIDTLHDFMYNHPLKHQEADIVSILLIIGCMWIYFEIVLKHMTKDVFQ